MSEIPQETLHQLYRGYCLDKFPYDYPEDQAEARERHIEYDARSYYAECGDVECEGNCGHVGALARLVEAAFAAGRESAYTTDDEIEWSCRMKDGRPAFASSFTEAGARSYAASDVAHLAVFKRRVGPWEKVADA